MKTNAEAQESSRKRQRTKTEKTALMKAVDLLARAEHSTAHLARKLLQRGYDEEEVRSALATLAERGYLDDTEACRHQFTFLYEESRQSVRQIQAKKSAAEQKMLQHLYRRGFSTAVCRAAVAAFAEDEDEED